MGRYILRYRAGRRGLRFFGNCGRSSEHRESAVLYFPNPVLGFAGWRIAPTELVNGRRGLPGRPDFETSLTKIEGVT
jgi:hypothetical protein